MYKKNVTANVTTGENQAYKVLIRSILAPIFLLVALSLLQISDVFDFSIMLNGNGIFLILIFVIISQATVYYYLKVYIKERGTENGSCHKGQVKEGKSNIP